MLLAPGCGPSKEQELYDRQRAYCDGAVASGLTLGDVERNYGIGPVFCDCGTTFARLPGDDQCDYGAVVCRCTWAWRASDPALCSPLGCGYLCQLGAPGTSQGTTSSARVCSHMFAKGQPY